VSYILVLQKGLSDVFSWLCLLADFQCFESDYYGIVQRLDLVGDILDVLVNECCHLTHHLKVYGVMIWANNDCMKVINRFRVWMCKGLEHH
jgi:hypothetical protein